MRLPLAIYTAEHGLAWKCSDADLSLSELESCKGAFGRLPDFDSGEKGFEGIAVRGDRVFVARCFKAAKWDFVGRDAFYLAMTWMPRSAFWKECAETIWAMPQFREPMREPPRPFEFEGASASEGGNEPENRGVFRREIGATEFVRMDAVGEAASELAEDGEKQPDDAKPPPMDSGRGKDWKSIFLWTLIAVFLAAVVGYFAYDVMKGATRDDGSGEVSEKQKHDAAGTNEVSGRAVSDGSAKQ